MMLLLTLPAVLWAISFHEFCHGYAAKLVGDPTAERSGRLSLNPLDHFDLVGTLMLLLVGFGWAKPVPINTRYFRHPRRDLVIVSLAGIAGNILTAVVCALFLRFLGDPWYRLAGRAGIMVLVQMIAINMGLAAFNLIPIPPLDGSRVLEAFLPFRYLRYYYWLERYGMIILLVLLMTGIVDVLFNPIFRLLWGLLPFGFSF
ncbi:site-2 protease family protein [uncultured Fretibacterium sp.]|uniref:site-2 protease family protein n=1 Tax=uncultured Fretibacterium sp. TaxID=1678694 RepID=UPI00260A0B90|nr:site-2 protease family protein [uncultured Fretibacterium sp.]